MKKFCILFIFVLLISCKKSDQERIRGTWEAFSDHSGIAERIFNGDTVVTKYYTGWDSDYCSVQKYTFIDNVLFIGSDAYNYIFFENKLFISGQYEIEIYTKKISEKSISGKKRLLTGHWQGHNFEMTFMDNDTAFIKETDDNMNIIFEGTYPYEITEKTITLSRTDKENNSGKFFSKDILRFDNYLYKVNNDTLILKLFHPESGLIIQDNLEKID